LVTLMPVRQVVIEFPTIYVVLPKSTSRFPMLIEEVVPQGVSSEDDEDESEEDEEEEGEEGSDSDDENAAPMEIHYGVQ
jgi:hypothetical protein